jgi:zinc transport system substrate-binding protein
MIGPHSNRLTLFCLAVLLGSMSAWSQSLKLVSTIKPVQLIVSEIAGKEVNNWLLLPPGVSPHHFSLKPSDARHLQAADAVFWIGPDLEVSLSKTLASHRGSVALASSDKSVPVSTDGHIWLDPYQARRMAAIIANTLIRVDAINEYKYRKNVDIFNKNLEKLHFSLQSMLTPLQGLRLVYHHDSYHYLEARYGLQGVGVLVPGHGSGAGVRNSVKIGKMLAKGEVDCVLTEPGLSNKLLTSLKVSEYSQLVAVDPLLGRPEAQPSSYSEFMLSLAAALQGCLGS